jgi:hypothetical protein
MDLIRIKKQIILTFYDIFCDNNKKLVIKNAQEIVGAFPQSVLCNKTFTSNQRQISKMYCCCFVIVDKQ